VDRAEGLALVARALDRGASWLTPDEVSALLGHYGIPLVRGRTVATAAEVEGAAADIGGPVVVKIVSSKLLHKTDVGGVRVNLRTPADARGAAEEMAKRVEGLGDPGALEGFLVQPMIADAGAEMFVGMTLDPSFGPLVACGAGGTLVELMRDVAVRITPLTDVDVHEMVRSLRTFPLLEGYRGAPRLDVAELEEILLRIGVMVEHLPHVAEIDLNPVMVMEEGKGCVVVDARIRVATPIPEAPRGARTRL
jgi:acyl-CoA synthetase (NDP forming)